MKPRIIFFLAALLCGLAFVLSACANLPPFEPIAKAHTSISRAQLAKADLYAPNDFTTAKDLVKRSEDSLYGYDYKMAQAYAEESAAMADLATAKTTWQIANAKVKESESDLRLITQTILDLNGSGDGLVQEDLTGESAVAAEANRLPPTEPTLK